MDNQNYENYSEDLLIDLELTGIKEMLSKELEGGYQYSNTYVPRVSELIRTTIFDDDKFNFALSNLKSKYEEIITKALQTGIVTHAMIEDYLIEGSRKDTINYMGKYPLAEIPKVLNCFNNFLGWFKYLKDMGLQFEVLKIEEKITCPWYGGTCDMIASITYPNGIKRTYVFDFKSSRKLSFEYYLQTMLYLKALNYNKAYTGSDLPFIDGIAVLRLDKTNPVFEYIVLDKDINIDFLNHLDQACNSIIDWYYYLKSTQYYFKQFTKSNKVRGDNYGLLY